MHMHTYTCGAVRDEASNTNQHTVHKCGLIESHYVSHYCSITLQGQTPSLSNLQRVQNQCLHGETGKRHKRTNTQILHKTLFRALDIQECIKQNDASVSWIFLTQSVAGALVCLSKKWLIIISALLVSAETPQPSCRLLLDEENAIKTSSAFY